MILILILACLAIASCAVDHRSKIGPIFVTVLRGPSAGACRPNGWPNRAWSGRPHNWPPTPIIPAKHGKFPPKDLGGDDAGTVKIEVKPVADQTNRRLVKVQADFPDDPLDRVRYSKELTLELQ